MDGWILFYYSIVYYSIVYYSIATLMLLVFWATSGTRVSFGINKVLSYLILSECLDQWLESLLTRVTRVNDYLEVHLVCFLGLALPAACKHLNMMSLQPGYGSLAITGVLPMSLNTRWSSSFTVAPGNMGRPVAISYMMQPTPLFTYK